MNITDIKPAVKTPGRWNIFVDGKYSFSLSETQLLDTGVKIGKELSEGDLASLKDDSEFGKAYARALELIFRRLRSRKELYDYARKKEWTTELRDRVIDKLESKGYVDDRKFAESWIRSRTAIKPSSRRKLEFELRQKGVSAGIVCTVLDEESEHDEQAALTRIITKKKARYPDESKFIAYLARQGFRYDEIKRALSDTTE